MPPTSTPSQSQIVEAIAPGEPARWLDEHGDAMYRYALTRLGSPELAEDAMQEALLGAIRSRGRFQGRSQERTWLIGILRHKVLDQITSQSRERRALSPGSPEDGPAPGWTRLPTSAPERAELRAALTSRIAQLPSPMREAFCLRELDGLNTASVCEILRLTPTNLWTMIHRAKRRLQQGLEKDGFGR